MFFFSSWLLDIFLDFWPHIGNEKSYRKSAGVKMSGFSMKIWIFEFLYFLGGIFGLWMLAVKVTVQIQSGCVPKSFHAKCQVLASVNLCFTDKSWNNMQWYASLQTCGIVGTFLCVRKDPKHCFCHDNICVATGHSQPYECHKVTKLVPISYDEL